MPIHITMTGWLTNAGTRETDMPTHLPLRDSSTRRPLSFPAQDIDVSTISRLISYWSSCAAISEKRWVGISVSLVSVLASQLIVLCCVLALSRVWFLVACYHILAAVYWLQLSRQVVFSCLWLPQSLCLSPYMSVCLSLCQSLLVFSLFLVPLDPQSSSQAKK